MHMLSSTYTLEEDDVLASVCDNKLLGGVLAICTMELVLVHVVIPNFVSTPVGSMYSGISKSL